MFMYETLMKNRSDCDRYLKEQEYLGQAILPGYALFGMGRFPGVVPNLAEKTMGELQGTQGDGFSLLPLKTDRALDKTVNGSKNRKKAVSYDLKSNELNEGYDLATSTAYSNGIVAAEFVSEEPKGLVKKPEDIEALNRLLLVTALLERLRKVSHQIHSGYTAGSVNWMK